MILVTGASGFIGKHVLKALINEYGAREVVALTSKPVSECSYLLHRSYTFEKDYFVQSGFESIDTIIHLGAFTPKNGEQADDWQQANSNILNTDKLIAAHLPLLKKVVYTSTLDVYGKDEVISEKSPIYPVSLYGESKLYCEKMLAAWAKAGGKQYQVLRVGHVYGPGEESYQKIIPVTFRKLLSGQPLQIWGTGADIRSFIYIDDVVSAILQSLKLTENTGVINLVGGQQVTIKKLMQMLIDISGKRVEIEQLPTTAARRDLVFDNTRMKELLLPYETSLSDGLKKEWDYLKQIYE